MTDDPVWHRVERELRRRAAKNLAPGDWSALGALIEASKQVITNWKTRGVPPKQHATVAQALGWSVDQLLGLEDRPSTNGGAPPVAPPADFHDRRTVSDSDWGLLEDIKSAATDDEIATIRARAAKLKAQVERMVEERLAASRATESRAFGVPTKTPGDWPPAPDIAPTPPLPPQTPGTFTEGSQLKQTGKKTADKEVKHGRSSNR